MLLPGPVAEIFHWRKLALSFAASLLALATMHGVLTWLPRTHVNLALALVVLRRVRPGRTLSCARIFLRVTCIHPTAAR
jgi:hypothetical protein